MGVAPGPSGAAPAGGAIDYAGLQKVQAEIAWLSDFYAAHPQWPVLDVTFSGVEETAARILHVATQRAAEARGAEGEVLPARVMEYRN